MKNNKAVFLLLGLTIAAAGGYIVYKKLKNKKEEPISSKEKVEVEETKQPESTEEVVEQPDKFIFGDNIAMMPEPTEIEVTEYTTKTLAYASENGLDNPFVVEKSEDSDDEVDWEEMKISKEYDAYVKKNKNKIIVLPEDKIEYTWCREEGNDPENPDVCYEEEELYYFTEDDTLTDEDGNVVDEEQYLGSKPRQFGWFTNEKEDIYIRNNPLERDFRVNKVWACREDYFPQ